MEVVALAVAQAKMMCGPNESKPWYRSKTVWFNILSIGGAILGGVVGLLPTLEMFIPPVAYAITLFALGVGNIILRAITTGPINWRDTDDVQSD